jgi:hypothetical protein
MFWPWIWWINATCHCSQLHANKSGAEGENGAFAHLTSLFKDKQNSSFPAQHIPDLLIARFKIITMANIVSSQEMIPATTFTSFSKLPDELQIKIV